MEENQDNNLQEYINSSPKGINSQETMEKLNNPDSGISTNQNNQNIQETIQINTTNNSNKNNSNQKEKKLLGIKTKTRKDDFDQINKKMLNEIYNDSIDFINAQLPVKNITFKFLKTEHQKGEYKIENIRNSLDRPIKEKLIKKSSPKFSSFYPHHNINLIQIIEKKKNKEEYKFVLDLIERKWIDYIKAFRGDYVNDPNEPLNKLNESRQEFINKLSSKYENEYIPLVKNTLDNYEFNIQSKRW